MMKYGQLEDAWKVPWGMLLNLQKILVMIIKKKGICSFWKYQLNNFFFKYCLQYLKYLIKMLTNLDLVWSWHTSLISFIFITSLVHNQWLFWINFFCKNIGCIPLFLIFVIDKLWLCTYKECNLIADFLPYLFI